MLHEEIQQALQAAMPKHEITVKPPTDMFCTVSASKGDKTRHCYVYLPNYEAAKDKGAYIKSRVDILTGGRRKDETEG